MNQPFGEIALSLSGGGYRAAAFHLGVLDFLDHVGLLRDVRTLSTVSGGTLTGMLYAVSTTERSNFADFYAKLYDFLRDTHVLGRALEYLDRDDEKFPGEGPSLIRAAAQVYASDALLGNRRFRQLLDSPNNGLKELVFNATEFRSGLAFRFLKSDSAQARIGNGKIPIPKEVAREIRLADILAASSCFPAAFEPMRFPDDFHWPEGHDLEQVRVALGAPFQPRVPLMDGGVYDNQGLESILLAYKRTGDAAGLVIISDTSQRNSSLFESPVRQRGGLLTLGRLVQWAWLLFVLSAVSAAALLTGIVRSLQTSGFRLPGDLFLFVIPFLLSITVVISLAWLRLRLGAQHRRILATTGLSLWQELRHLTIGGVTDMVEVRVRSLIALTSSVFMKRVRSLVFRNVYVYAKYKGKLVSNLIYDLAAPGKGILETAPWLAPSPALQRLVTKAESMATTLWFSDEDELTTLVACGQATICFNILKFILEEHEPELHDSGSAVAVLYSEARAAWEQLNGDPLVLMRRPRSR